MKSYTEGKALYGSLTNLQSAANLALGVQIANDKYRHLCALKDWPWLEHVRTLSTTASTQAMNLPYDCDQVREISVVPNGQTTRYVPRLSPSAAHWDWLNQSTFTSDTPEWYFVRAGQLLLWPVPVQTGNTVYVTQKCRVIDLSIADYTTGTIVSIANGGTAVVGSGTSWTNQMVGRYIRITYSDTVNKGDGLWYEISAVADTTHLTLVRAYGGLAISAGAAAYTLGQMPLLPESFHDTPWLAAIGAYWKKERDSRGPEYLDEYLRHVKELTSTWSSPTTDMVIDDGQRQTIENPNNFIVIP